MKFNEFLRNFDANNQKEKIKLSIYYLDIVENKEVTIRKVKELINSSRSSIKNSYISVCISRLKGSFIKSTDGSIRLTNEGIKEIKENYSINIQGSEMVKNNIFDQFNIHNEIRNVSEKLFYDGHYARAVEEAYKKIINKVKIKSDYPRDKNGRLLDGKGLMFDVFDKNNPKIMLNDLSSRSKENEQEGFMHIFAGVTQGIRNPNAHENSKMENREKTMDFLVLSSLLCKIIDDKY